MYRRDMANRDNWTVLHSPLPVGPTPGWSGPAREEKSRDQVRPTPGWSGPAREEKSRDQLTMDWDGNENPFATQDAHSADPVKKADYKQGKFVQMSTRSTAPEVVDLTSPPARELRRVAGPGAAPLPRVMSSRDAKLPTIPKGAGPFTVNFLQNQGFVQDFKASSQRKLPSPKRSSEERSGEGFQMPDPSESTDLDKDLLAATEHLDLSAAQTTYSLFLLRFNNSSLQARYEKDKQRLQPFFVLRLLMLFVCGVGWGFYLPAPFSIARKSIKLEICLQIGFWSWLLFVTVFSSSLLSVLLGKHFPCLNLPPKVHFLIQQFGTVCGMLLACCILLARTTYPASVTPCKAHSFWDFPGFQEACNPSAAVGVPPAFELINLLLSPLVFQSVLSISRPVLLLMLVLFYASWVTAFVETGLATGFSAYLIWLTLPLTLPVFTPVLVLEAGKAYNFLSAVKVAHTVLAVCTYAGKLRSEQSAEMRNFQMQHEELLSEALERELLSEALERVHELYKDEIVRMGFKLKEKLRKIEIPLAPAAELSSAGKQKRCSIEPAKYPNKPVHSTDHGPYLPIPLRQITSTESKSERASHNIASPATNERAANYNTINPATINELFASRSVSQGERSSSSEHF
eukprot:g21720.t1